VTTSTSPRETTLTPPEPAHRTGLWVGVGAAGLVALAALVTLVLIVALGVLDDGLLPSSAASRALLTTADVASLSGVSIAHGGDSKVTKSTLHAYVKNNPTTDPSTVMPSRCADNLEGWMAWAPLDTPSYRGWNHDVIYAATNIVVDSVSDYGYNIQQSRRFISVAAATQFMSAQRSWYHECGHASYTDPSDSDNNATYDFSPLPVDVGLDSIIEGSTDRGKYAPPHLIDVYLRNRNIVYVTEVATNSAPRDGLDRVSLAIVRAAATKVGDLG
jgi:hypothetical protein